jgi:hypothetical protein
MEGLWFDVLVKKDFAAFESVEGAVGFCGTDGVVYPAGRDTKGEFIV